MRSKNKTLPIYQFGPDVHHLFDNCDLTDVTLAYEDINSIIITDDANRTIPSNAAMQVALPSG